MSTAFNQIFNELDAPDYPATCDNCGYTASNAEMQTHSCSEAVADWDHRDESERLHYLIGEGPEQ